MSRLSFIAEWRNVVRDSDLPRTTKLVAHTLATYMDADGMTGPGTRETPSIVRLARGASLGRKVQKDNTAVKNALARLESDGFLEIDRRRGQRGWTYSARIPRVGGGFESPAGTGESAERIPRGRANESPAKTSGIPRRDGGEVEESERESDDDDVGDLAEVLKPLGTLTRDQRADAEFAWTERPEGVRALVAEALDPSVRRPIALFVHRIREGAHREIEIEPPLSAPREPEPCSECGFEFGGHAPDCFRAPRRDEARSVCPECQVGGGRHTVDCSLGREAAA